MHAGLTHILDQLTHLTKGSRGLSPEVAIFKNSTQNSGYARYNTAVSWLQILSLDT